MTCIFYPFWVKFKQIKKSDLSKTEYEKKRYSKIRSICPTTGSNCSTAQSISQGRICIYRIKYAIWAKQKNVLIYKMRPQRIRSPQICAFVHISLSLCGIVKMSKCGTVPSSQTAFHKLRDVASDKKLFFCEFERTLPYLRKKIYPLHLQTTHRII